MNQYFVPAGLGGIALRVPVAAAALASRRPAFFPSWPLLWGSCVPAPSRRAGFRREQAPLGVALCVAGGPRPRFLCRSSVCPPERSLSICAPILGPVLAGLGAYSLDASRARPISVCEWGSVSPPRAGTRLAGWMATPPWLRWLPAATES